MKASLRKTLAAALLAAPAALLVAQPALADHRHGGRDQRPPQITDVTPDHGDRIGDRGRTRISARFHDEGSGVQAVWLRVDGRDVTRKSRLEHDTIRFRDDLAPGRHVAEVMVRDRAGNVNRRAWSFVVVDRDRGYGYGYGRGYDDRYGGHDQPRHW